VHIAGEAEYLLIAEPCKERRGHETPEHHKTEGSGGVAQPRRAADGCRARRAACDHHPDRRRGRARGEPAGGRTTNVRVLDALARPSIPPVTHPPGIRLLIADGDVLARDALSDLFSREQGIDVIGVAADGHEAVRIAGERSPDVVLTEVTMPGLGGVEVARQIRVASPSSKVVMLTSLGDHRSILDSIDGGAIGYIFKDEDGAEVIRAVRAAFRGESPLSARATTAILSSRVAPPSSAVLTDRELQVLRLVAVGMSNKEVATALAISEKTVKAHMTSVLRSTGTGNRSAATRWFEERATA
jgi:DNA-binding NarL/FixJ family response regulator